MPNGKLDSLAVPEVAGSIMDLLAKLAGKDAAAWSVAFKRFLRKENPWTEALVAMPAVASSAPCPWKTVTLGLLKTAEAYNASFAAKKREVGTWAAQIMAKIRYAQKPRKVDLFLVLDTDLGLTEAYGIADVLAAAKAKGYKKCPPEVGPALRDQYDDQPMNEWLPVLMDPVLVSDADLGVFHVGRDSNGAHLDADCANPEYRFSLGARWVVCRSAASV